MQTEKRLWLIACVVFLAAAGFAIFAGFSIAGMTGRGEIKPSGSNTDEEDPFASEEEGPEEPVETLPPASETAPEEEETEPSSEEPATLPEPAAGNIHLLSSEELDQIRNLYSSEVTAFHSAGERDEQNRPVLLTALSQDLTEHYKNVRIFNGGSDKSVSLIFLLTAENGRNTELILNHLLARGVKATFFIDYYYAAQNQGLIARMIEEGHEIGSLGYHLPEGGIAYSDIADQQQDAMDLQQAVEEMFHYTMSKYYFGYDAYSEQSLALMTQMGYTVVFFSSSYPDYNATEAIDTAAFLETMKNELHPNAVYCLHTVNNSTVDMIPGLLDHILNSGYQITLIQ